MAASQEPPERDVKDFEFRQLCKCRVYPSPVSESALPVNRVQLLASSSKFGLIFCAFNNEIKVLCMAALSQKDQSVDARERSTGIADAPYDKHFTVPAPVVHIAISCDDIMLSVVTDDGTNRQLMIFSITAFADQNTTPVPLACHQLSSGGNSLLKDLTWNPAFPLLLAVCLSDGSVILLEVGQIVSVKAMAALPATCLSWSPKGKQIMVGNLDGSCRQYDHEFKLKKDWSAPAIFSETHQMTDIVWISTYTFLASYLPQTADNTIQPVVVMTVSNKEGNLTFINFDDVCFGSGETRQAKYYFQYLIQWEMIIMTSCAATETTIVAKHLDSKTHWEHWNLEDSCRAELPVTDDQADSFPLGMSVTLASQQSLQLGESKTHPPCPVLLLLSTDGVLVPFHMAYFHAEAPVLTAAPLPVTSSQGTAVGPPAPAPALTPAATQVARPALAGLLSSPSTAPSLSAPAVIGSTQAAAPTLPGMKPLFTLPASVPSFTESSQPAPPSSSATPSFSFAPAGGAASVASGTSVTPKPPAYGFVGLGGEGSQAFGGAGFGARPQGSSVKTNLFGAFSPAAPTSAASPANGGGTGGATAATVSKSVPSAGAPAAVPAGAPALSVPGSTMTQGDVTPKTFSFASADPSRPGGEGPSLQGSRPAAPTAMAGFGATGAGGSGFGQFSFSFSKGAPATSATPAALPPPYPVPASSSLATAGAGFSSPVPSSVSASASSSAPPPSPAAAPAVSAVPPAGSVNSTFVKAPAASSRNGLAGVPVATSRPLTAPGGARKPEAESDAILDSTITQMIGEEMEDFEKELQNLRARMGQAGPLVGTKAEMQSLCHKTAKMESFSKEVTSTTQEHCRDVYDLKGSCLDMFAMAEECRCRQERNSDAQYLRSLQQRTLDPATAQRLRRLRLAAQQIGQSLQDADAVLDSQWEAHVEKEKKTRIRIPNCDTMYRAIRSNHNVLVAQHHELERVQDQLRRLQIKNQTSPWNSFSSCVNGSDEPRGSSGRPSATPLTSQTQRDWRLKKSDLLTPEKVALLKESLANHQVRKVKCQPLVSLSQSRLVSMRNELRTSSVVSSDSSLQSGSTGVRESDSSAPASAAAVAAVSRAEGRGAPVLTSTPAMQPTPPAKEAPRMMQPPTSFSGMAYFKPKPTLPDTPASLPAQPGFAFAPALAGTGAIFKNPQMMPGAIAPGFGASSFTAYPSSQAASVPLPLLPTPNQDRYENVTPTSFDDKSNDEEDDNGYEEEDEEDEDEVGFGDQYVYPDEDDTLNGSTGGMILATPLSNMQVAATKPPGSGVSKNLFSVPASEAGDSASPASLSAFGAGATRGSIGFALGTNSLLTSHLSGKPAFGSAETAGQDGGPKAETGETTPTASSAFGTRQEAAAALGAGFGIAAAKTTSITTPTTTTTAASAGLFGVTKSAPADSTTPAAAASTTTASKLGGGLFGSGATFGAGSTFGATSSASAAAPSSPPVGFFTATGSAAANTTTAGGFSFSANATSNATSNTPTAASSAFGTSSSGSSVFGSSGSGGAFSFTSLISKTEPVTTAASSGVGGDAVVSSAPQGTSSGKPALFAATQPALASSTDVKVEAVSQSSSVTTTASTTPSFGALAAATTTTPTDTATITAATSVSSPAANAGAASPVSSGGGEGLLDTTPAKPLFAATVAGSSPASGPALFGATTSTSSDTNSVFGSTTQATSTPSAGLFVSATTAAPSAGLLGSAATTTSAPSTGLFGSAATTTSAPSTGLFGSAATTTSAPSTGLFGSAPATTSAPSSGLFGSATTTTSAPTPGLFGSATTATPSPGLFGSPTATAPPVGLFGSAATSTTTASAGSATPSTGGLFAAATTTSSGTPSLFSTATTGGGSLFGGTPASSGGSVFGSSSGGQTSVFGSPATTASSGSVFGASTADPASETPSLGFETSSDNSTPSLGFGQPSGAFGGFSKPAFGSAPAFGQTTPGFGQSASTGGGFGQTQTPAASGFGSSGFGQTTTTTTESGSGGSFGGLFGGGGSGGGGGIFGLGAKPSEEKAKQNVFGTVQAFGASSTSNNTLFGNKGPTAFGGGNSPQAGATGNPFGGGASTGGSNAGFGASQSTGSGVASMGFAVTQSTSSSVGGFGNSPGFGSSPSFGGSAFGSAPVFGGSPGFGTGIGANAGGAFGSTPSFTSPFGAGQQTPTSGGFSSFASTNTPSFGSLAQVSDMPTFGSMNQGGGGGFGAMAGSQAGGGFGAQSPGFGGASPGFGSQQPQQPAGFGNTSFGSSPSFSSYRG